MQNQSVSENLPSIEPLIDTWRILSNVGTWYITLDNLDFTHLSYQEINEWYYKTVTNTLEAFSEFGRVWKVFLSPSNREKFKGIVLEWQLEESYQVYVEKVLRAIKTFPDIICTLEISIDLLVFVRTKQSPNKPIRAWIRNLGSFSFCGGLIHGKPFLYFDIEHTLFCLSTYYDENVELYSLNQPLLENTLRSWEQKIGKINEVEGIEGIYEYGFLPDLLKT